jgi:GT2 family glycosyltransferase
VNVSILIGTFGDSAWRDLAWSHAYPSAIDQGAAEVRVLHLEDGTLAEARNQLAENANGDWLCFLDADDALDDGYVDAMVDAVTDQRRWGRNEGEVPEYSDPLALYVPAVQAVRDGRCVGPTMIPNQGGWPEVNECVIGTLIPRALFLDVGGFRDEFDDGTPLTSLEDYDLFLRCWDAGARLVYVPSAVYCATVSTDGRNANQGVYPKVWAEHLSRRREAVRQVEVGRN